MYSHVIAVTNRHLSRRAFPEQIERICRLHPQAVILREKDLSEKEYYVLAEEVLSVCRRYGTECILHSFPEAARELGVTRIHLPLGRLREMSYRSQSFFKCIGSSVHSRAEAVEAGNLHASYITAGHIYATDCKKGLAPRGTGFLKDICEAVDIPVYGIGGIRCDAEQIREVMACGAAGACIMSGMMQA